MGLCLLESLTGRRCRRLEQGASLPKTRAEHIGMRRRFNRRVASTSLWRFEGTPPAQAIRAFLKIVSIYSSTNILKIDDKSEVDSR